MKEHYVSYDCAVKLKELGFDESCEFYYNPYQVLRISKDSLLSPRTTNNRFLEEIADGMATAPRLDQAQAWLREKKNVDIDIETIYYPGKRKYKCSCARYIDKPFVIDGSEKEIYEEAISEIISECLKLLTDK